MTTSRGFSAAGGTGMKSLAKTQNAPLLLKSLSLQGGPT
jgi:hypothetical protein